MIYSFRKYFVYVFYLKIQAIDMHEIILLMISVKIFLSSVSNVF